MTQSNVTIGAELRASDIVVQVRDYIWPCPSASDIQVEPEPTLALRLSSPPSFAEAHHRINPASTRFSRLGDLIFHPPAIPIHARGSGGKIQVVTCGFSRARFETLAGIADDGWDASRLRACLDVRGTPVDGALMRLAREAISPGFASGILVESLTIGLIVELARFLDASVSPEGTTTGRLAPWQLRRLIEYVEAHTGGSPTMADLAALCGISPDHLGRVFRRTTGQSVMAFVGEVRMRKARTLLSQTNLTLKEISYRLGFPSQSGFSIAFRRAAGETPKQFRQQFRRARGAAA
jgi:AraC family transcriptional regulator